MQMTTRWPTRITSGWLTAWGCAGPAAVNVAAPASGAEDFRKSRRFIGIPSEVGNSGSPTATFVPRRQAAAIQALPGQSAGAPAPRWCERDHARFAVVRGGLAAPRQSTRALSALPGGLREERREHRLDLLAFAFGTERRGLAVFGDGLMALEDLTALGALVLVRGHSDLLLDCRRAWRAGIDPSCAPTGAIERAGILGPAHCAVHGRGCEGKARRAGP